MPPLLRMMKEPWKVSAVRMKSGAACPLLPERPPPPLEPAFAPAVPDVAQVQPFQKL
jgi:hypothetical protein